MKSYLNKLKVYLGLSDKHCGHCGSDNVTPQGYYILKCNDCKEQTIFEFGHAGIDGHKFEEEKSR